MVKTTEGILDKQIFDAASQLNAGCELRYCQDAQTQAGKGGMYNSAVRNVLLHRCETWLVRAKDIYLLSVHDSQWEHRVSNDEARPRVLGVDSRSVKELLSLHRLP